MSRPLKQSIQEGFDKFVIRKPGCWDWSGCCPENPGYPQFRSDLKIYRAHRASWILHFGEIPNGAWVCHTCDNRRCSNPDHLFLGSSKENVLDMCKKNRSPILHKKGQNNPMSKLSNYDVEQIRLLLNQGISQSKIGKQFNVSQTAISVINTEKYWR